MTTVMVAADLFGGPAPQRQGVAAATHRGQPPAPFFFFFCSCFFYVLKTLPKFLLFINIFKFIKRNIFYELQHITLFRMWPLPKTFLNF